jgi:hypothetical protein
VLERAQNTKIEMRSRAGAWQTTFKKQADKQTEKETAETAA